MRYGIFSDVHSNLEALDAVFGAYQREDIDKYLCAGDVVGYAANPKECIEKVKRFSSVTVAGNHDWASANRLSLDYFNPLAKEAIIWTENILDEKERYYLEGLNLVFKNQDLTMVHGTLDEPGVFDYMTGEDTASRTFELMDTDICFVGHTHLPGVFVRLESGKILYQEGSGIELGAGNKYIVNVGSVGQPRDGNPGPAYCIYDTKSMRVEVKRAGYDTQLARKKVIDAGLPEFFGSRLHTGR